MTRSACQPGTVPTPIPLDRTVDALLDHFCNSPRGLGQADRPTKPQSGLPQTVFYAAI